MILALDGGKNIGWALFTESGADSGRGIISNIGFFSDQSGPFTSYGRSGGLEFMTCDISTIVVEGIMHNPNIDQGGSQRWESQVEGAARILASIHGLMLVVQRPADALSVTLMHEGMEWPRTKTGNKKHLPDDLAAWLHGRYYLRTIGVLQ